MTRGSESLNVRIAKNIVNSCNLSLERKCYCTTKQVLEVFIEPVVYPQLLLAKLLHFQGASPLLMWAV